MGNEELSLVQMLKNLYQKRNVLFNILVIFTILALGYTIINDMLIKETSAIVLIDKADASIDETVTVLNTDKVKATFDKSKKTITFKSSGIDSNNCELQVQEQMKDVEAKLVDTFNIQSYKIIQTVTTERISIFKIVKDIAIFEIVGLVLYCGYVFLITAFSTTTDEYVIQNITKLKVLGKLYKTTDSKNVSKLNKLMEKFIGPDENISIEKQLRIIKTNIELNKDIKEPKTILFVSSDKRVKNDEVLRMLAKEYSTENKKIMILAYNIEKYENIGLNAVNSMKLSDNDSSKQEAEELISELGANYDMIIIDGSNINENHLSIIFSNIVDTNIIVAELGKTKLEDISKTKQYIEDVDGKISGTILSKI